MGAETDRSVRALAEAINRRDVDAAVAVCDPEIEFLSVLAVSGKAYRGHAGILRNEPLRESEYPVVEPDRRSPSRGAPHQPR
jgi:hypothetical protein